MLAMIPHKIGFLATLIFLLSNIQYLACAFDSVSQEKATFGIANDRDDQNNPLGNSFSSCSDNVKPEDLKPSLEVISKLTNLIKNGTVYDADEISESFFRIYLEEIHKKKDTNHVKDEPQVFPRFPNDDSMLLRLKLLDHVHADEDITAFNDVHDIHYLVNDLVNAAKERDSDALAFLAEQYMFGTLGVQSAKTAFSIYKYLASQGDANAQFYSGFLLSTGLLGEINLDESILYHHLASANGDIRSDAILGYYYDQGIGLKHSPEKAAHHYRRAALGTLTWYQQGPLGRREVILHAFHYPDEEQGGLYGKGASVNDGYRSFSQFESSKVHLKNIDHVMDYMDIASNSGEPEPSINLAYLNYFGSRILKPDYQKSWENAQKVARSCWDEHGNYVRREDEFKVYCGAAAALLGTMLVRGEGVKLDYEKAAIWFNRGAQMSSSKSFYNLGVINLHGLGASQNITQARKYFKKASALRHTLANTALAKMDLVDGKFESAFGLLSGRQSNFDPETMFLLAEMRRRGLGINRDLSAAIRMYQTVLEHIEGPMYRFEEANALREMGNNMGCLLLQMMAAEMGHEAGQLNTAYLADNVFITFDDDIVTEQLSLGSKISFRYYSRSARQQNTDSLVKLADYLLAGAGCKEDPMAAYEHYRIAAAKSSQAAWNLGWMHENGIGVKKDFNLAQFFFELALQKSPKAYIPVISALTKLKIKWLLSSVHFGEGFYSNLLRTIRDSYESFFSIIDTAGLLGKQKEASKTKSALDKVTSPRRFPVGEIIRSVLIGSISIFALAFFNRLYRQRVVRRVAPENEQPHIQG